MAGTHRAARLLASAAVFASSAVLVAPQMVTAATSDLLISEYVEGSSFNKAVEIYNGTGSPVDLSTYTLELYSNGSPTPSQSVALSGTVADGEVFVVAHASADPAILAETDLQNSSVANFNGDDGIALRNGGALVDSFGQQGVDPGSEWPGGGANDTLRRQPTVCAGDTDFSDAFDASVEWVSFASNTFDGLGSHTADCDGPVGPSAPVINELGISDASTDNEFAEFFGDPNTDYSAYTLLSVEGEGTAAGTIDRAVPLGTTDANGLFTVDPAPSFENGGNSFLLVEGFTGAVADDIDGDNDGTIDNAPWAAIADSVAVDDGGSGDLHYGTPVLDESFDDARIDNGFAPGGLSRIPDGTDTDTAADWYRNDFSWDGVTNGSPEPGEALNTPGALNEIVPPPAAAILINEVDADQDGTDAAEFVELTSGDVGGASLDGLVLVLFNGSDDASYEAYDLDGLTTGPDGYFVACANPATTANCDLDIDGFFNATTNVIQNGADAVALFEGDAADFPNDTPVTDVGLIDAIVYDTNDGDDAGLLAVLNTAGGQVNEGENGNQTGHSNSRCPDGSGTALDTSAYDAVPPTPGAANDCDGGGGPELKLIHEIQGDGDASPLDGQPVIISGIVVGDYQEIVTADPTDEALEGFFVQEEDADADTDANTSEGIFVFYPANAVAVSVGDLVEVTGTVDEFFGLTEIVNVTDVTVVSSGNPAPTPATPTLPTAVGDPTVNWEAIEGMSVSFSQPLYVTGMFPLGAFGEVQLSAIGAQDHPNQIHPVGSQAAIDQRQLNEDARVILEDGEDENENFSGISSWNPTPTPFLGGPENTLRSGDEVVDLAGVVNYTFGEYEVIPVNVADPTDPDGAVTINRTPRPVGVPDVGGELTVASFNVLNYFVTIDNGDPICGPPGFEQRCRGADTQSEFDTQAAKIADAVADLDADIVGLIELQNSGNDEAIADLVAKVNALSSRTYDYVPTGFIGTDVIAVGFIYDTATVGLDGSFAILDSSVSPAFIDDENRPALAQTFTDLGSNNSVTVAVNHLKSKGSPCDDVANPGDPAFGVAPYAVGDDPDVGPLGDPQYTGNCNLTRTAAAQVLGGWMAADPTGTGAENTLIIGDLNAYANETPITALEGLGYTDLNEAFNGTSWTTGGHTYVFDGELGALDYAMSNAALTPFVTGAAAWHINADEPFAIDYQNFNPPGQSTLDEWKSSDHDPVLVGLSLETVYECAGVSGTLAQLEAAGYNVLIGDDRNNFIVGTNGPDFILGEGGNDSIFSRRGDDVVCGGDGNDGIWTNRGHDIVDGGDGKDSVFASSGNDTVFGGDGNDALFGGGGADDLFGEAGDDFLSGNGGRDVCDGGADTDVAHRSCETKIDIP